MFMWTESFYGFTVDMERRLPVPLLRLTRGVFSSDPSFNLQYLSWFLLAGIIFIVLRILGQIRPLKTFLCQLVGSTVFLVPLFGTMPTWTTRPSWWTWLWVEGAVAAGAALLYADRTRSATGAFLAAAALLHFGLWGLVYFPDGHWCVYRCTSVPTRPAVSKLPSASAVKSSTAPGNFAAQREWAFGPPKASTQ